MTGAKDRTLRMRAVAPASPRKRRRHQNVHNSLQKRLRFDEPPASKAWGCRFDYVIDQVIDQFGHRESVDGNARELLAMLGSRTNRAGEGSVSGASRDLALDSLLT